MKSFGWREPIRGALALAAMQRYAVRRSHYSGAGVEFAAHLRVT